MKESQFYHFEAIIRKRIKRNKNFLCVVCGETGSGKSFSTIKMAEDFDPNFSLDNLVFNAKDFMKVVQRAKKGSVIIFDEAGVGMPSREWMTQSNRLLSFVIQTFRHKNLIVYFTVPDFGMVDAQARKLFHCYMQTCGINESKKICYLKPLFIQNNPKMGKLYYKYPKVFNGGNLLKIKRMGVSLPSKWLISQYEAKKKAFTNELNKGVQLTIKDRFESKEKGTGYVCLDCGHRWRSRGLNAKKYCPKCQRKHLELSKNIP